ncbi:MAG: response regulator [Azospirillaceae bacterium]|nr:response regulator [Azospirillaceae bacterium]
MPETILVVDDDQDMCWVLEATLAGIGCAVTTVISAHAAISVVAARAFPVAIVDARLPDMDGLLLIERLREFQPAMRIIVISGYYLDDDTRISEAVRASKINGFFTKPFRIEAIVTAAAGRDDGENSP